MKTQCRQESVPGCRATDSYVSIKPKRGGSTPLMYTFVLVIICTDVASSERAFPQISSFPAGPVHGRIVATSEALEQPVPERLCAATASPSQSSAEECGPFKRNTYPGTIYLRYGWPHGHLAQSGGFQVEEISSPSGRAVPIRITLPKEVRQPDAVGSGPAFLMFRGLPPEITLSAGFRLRDAWAVSLSDASDLRMSSPPGYQGSYMLTVTLHKGQSTNPETRMIAVRLGPTVSSDGAVSALPVPPTPAPAPKAELDSVAVSITGKVERLGEGEEIRLLENADEMLKTGDIEAARLVYSELSAHGSAKAAFLMAQTYDPQVLEEHFIVGLQPDAELARQWYSRAGELGDRDAKERLRQLQTR